MITDWERFVEGGRPHWEELEAMLDRIEEDPSRKLDLAGVRRLHQLYRRAAFDLNRVSGFAAAPELRATLEALVSRAHGEIHEIRGARTRFSPLRWFLRSFPASFRRHGRAFLLAAAATLAGALFGAGAVALDPGAKAILIPFEHLQQDPRERVAQEEAEAPAEQSGGLSFSAYLMTHNIRVSVIALALGISWGIGTLLLLFGNGVILGAVGADYLLAGQGPFLFGWLLPHGAVEIPAILVGGQAGLVLAGAMLDRASGLPLGERLRRAGGDAATLAGGLAVLLVWAGLVESLLSQHHEPTLPYGVKIAFGLLEIAALALLLARGGRKGNGSAGG